MRTIDTLTYTDRDLGSYNYEYGGNRDERRYKHAWAIVSIAQTLGNDFLRAPEKPVQHRQIVLDPMSVNPVEQLAEAQKENTRLNAEAQKEYEKDKGVYDRGMELIAQAAEHPIPEVVTTIADVRVMEDFYYLTLNDMLTETYTSTVIWD